MQNFLNRLKSPVTIPAILALIYFVVKNWIGFDIPGWEEFVTLVMAAALAFGIVNNPTNKEGF